MKREKIEHGNWFWVEDGEGSRVRIIVDKDAPPATKDELQELFDSRGPNFADKVEAARARRKPPVKMRAAGSAYISTEGKLYVSVDWARVPANGAVVRLYVRKT